MLEGSLSFFATTVGVEFIEAFVDIELQELNLYNPDETVQGKLLLTKKQGVLAVQVSTGQQNFPILCVRILRPRKLSKFLMVRSQTHKATQQTNLTWLIKMTYVYAGRNIITNKRKTNVNNTTNLQNKPKNISKSKYTKGS